MSLRRLGSGHLAGWLCVAAVLALCGCGQFFPPLSNSTNGSGSSGSANYIYAGNLGTSPYTIAGFSIANSTLSAISGSPFDVASAGEPAAMTVYGNYLYMSSSSALGVGGVYSYPIESNGALGTGTGVALGPAAIQVDTTGQWLIGVDTTLDQAYAFRLDSATGQLTAPIDSSTVSLANCASTNLDGLPPGLAIAPGDKYIYVSCGTGGVYTLSFDSSTGGLAQVNSVLNHINSNGADFGLAINPSGNLLFAAETLAGVRVFTISSTNGTLTEVKGSPFATGNGPDAVLVDSTGSYVYVANRTDGTISGFLLPSTGVLSAISGSPFATGTAPIALAEDSSHTYILAACNGGSYGLEAYSISSATPGALVSLKNVTTGSGTTGTYSLAATR